jgi:hypothetical protein
MRIAIAAMVSTTLMRSKTVVVFMSDPYCKTISV